MKNATLLIGLVLLLAGCGGGGPPAFRGDPFATADSRSLIVLLENNTTEDVQVEARSPRDRHDLGFVNGRSARQTSIPWASLGSLRFQLETRSGRRVNVQGPSVGPGERVTLVIVSPIDQSFIRN